MANALTPVLEIQGLVRGGGARFDREQLSALDASAQIEDAGTLVSGKRGRAVKLAAIARAAGVDAEALHVHMLSSESGFQVSVPIGEVLARAVVVYELDGKTLPPEKGGPFRLLACGHLDECVSVKALAKISFLAAPGVDTRPKNDEEHRRLHERARANAKPQ
ncbi:MAG: molybdopterin-dependent oxidoreductase [Planctomycetota bacterium]|nr:molybdopterin-dependent oxidoreductase [Planctomycetota bacterium]